MEKPELRKALANWAESNGVEEGVLLFTDLSYDNSIIGVTEDGRAVYDMNKMMEEFAEDEGCDSMEAIEWIEYNTIRAIPYMGERCPIIITPVDEITDCYGD